MKIKREYNGIENIKSINIILLIITIIVMLILSGVAISMNLEENGLFKTERYEETEYKPEITYEIIEKVGTKYKVVIVAKNDLGIQKLECPNELQITCNNKNKIAIDYEIEQNTEHKFIMELSNKTEETFIININPANDTIIKESTVGAYPIISERGIIVGKNIDIEYNKQDTKNYYSLDNGNTWVEYTNSVNMTYTGTIKAKSVMSNGVAEIVSKKISISLASDAMPQAAYDGNSETYFFLGRYASRIMLVDSSMYGKQIYLTARTLARPSPEDWAFRIYAFLKDGSSTICYSTQRKDEFLVRKPITIPENTKYLKFQGCTIEGVGQDIKEIEVK